MHAFDTDCLIFAAAPSHALGARVHDLLAAETRAVGSVMLLPELLIKPIRVARLDEQSRLLELLSRIELLDVTNEVARAAAALGAKYGLRAVDSVHLATAVVAGADRFVTNNRRDFSPAITEVDVVYPSDL